MKSKIRFVLSSTPAVFCDQQRMLAVLAALGAAAASPERDCALNILAFEFGAARVHNTAAL